VRPGIEARNEGVSMMGQKLKENKLYSSAKICLKFHEREADGSQPHLIVNQRVFKIAACGGFQVYDAVPPIRKYFAEGEIVLADPNRPDEWFRKIDYYLTHDDERTRIQAKGTARALREHTYHNRVTTLLGLYTRQVISATNARADHG
jgi:spore maturation protein CgeB